MERGRAEVAEAETRAPEVQALDVQALEVKLELEGDELALSWTPPAPGGATLLYMHGFGSCQDGEKAGYFRRRAAAAGLGFCSFDFRGHGRSGGELGQVTFSRNLRDAATVLAWVRQRLEDDGGGSPLVFFGSSMGGAVGLWLAGRHPGAFAAGLAIAPAVGMGTALAGRLGEAAMEEWRTSGRLRFVNDMVDDDLEWALMEDLEGYPASALAGLFATPTCTPTLIFQGMRDESVDWRLAVELAEAVATRAGAEEGGDERQVEVHLFSAGDHRLLDHRPRMWRMALGFLERRGLLPDIRG